MIVGFAGPVVVLGDGAGVVFWDGADVFAQLHAKASCSPCPVSGARRCVEQDQKAEKYRNKIGATKGNNFCLLSSVLCSQNIAAVLLVGRDLLAIFEFGIWNWSVCTLALV